jgi:hypothetical protein
VGGKRELSEAVEADPAVRPNPGASQASLVARSLKPQPAAPPGS